MAARKPQWDDRDEVRLEEIRRDPEVVVHRRETPRPKKFTPGIRVVTPIDVRDLLGRCDDDEQPHTDRQG